MKRAVQSRTLWFSTLSLLAIIGTAILADENLKSLFGDNIGYLMGFVSVCNIALRLATTKAIGKENLEILDETDWDEE